MTVKPQLSFLDATLYTVIMSMGLRWLPVAASVGPASLPLWVLALITFFIPLSTATAELTDRFKGEGGIYLWTRDTFGPLAGFICGWFYWFALMPYFAGILYFLAGLLMAALGLNPKDQGLYLLFCVGLGAGVTAFQFAGLRLNKWLTNLGAAGGWAIFLLIAGIAAWLLTRGVNATDFAHASYVAPFDFGTAILWGTIVFAFSGVEAVGLLRNDIAGGIRTVVRVLAVVGAMATVLYIAGTAAMLVILPASQMTRLNGFADTLRAVFASVHWPAMAPWSMAFLAIAMLGGLVAWFGAGVRLPLAAGLDHFLPAAFGRRNPRTGAPDAAILLTGGLMLLFVVLGQAGATASVAYDFLVAMGVLTNTICYVFLFAAYFAWSRAGAEPGAWQPPGGSRTSLVLAAMGVVSTLVAIVCSLAPNADDAHPWQTFFKIAISTLAALVVGLGLYWLGLRRKAAAAAA